MAATESKEIETNAFTQIELAVENYIYEIDFRLNFKNSSREQDREFYIKCDAVRDEQIAIVCIINEWIDLSDEHKATLPKTRSLVRKLYKRDMVNIKNYCI